MAMDDAREQMVQQQVRAWDVLDERVLDLLRQVPRERFVPEEHRYLAYADTEIPLPHAQHMLRPNVVGRLLQSLDLSGAERVLQLGAGTGFVTACLARAADSVRALELFDDLARAARTNLAAVGCGNVELVVADANELEGSAPYDAIAVTASLPRYPQQLERLLRPGGRMFVVVGEPPVMEAMVVRCVMEGACARETLFETVIDPMVNAQRPRDFSF